MDIELEEELVGVVRASQCKEKPTSETLANCRHLRERIDRLRELKRIPVLSLGRMEKMTYAELTEVWRYVKGAPYR